MCSSDLEPGELFFLQHAQQLHLRVQGQIAHLVEKERALIGQLDLSHLAVLVRAREGPGHVAEDLGLEKLLGDGCAVDAYERAVLTAAGRVDGACGKLLAGTGRPEDEDGGIRARIAQEVGLEGGDGRADAEDGIHGVIGREHTFDPPGVGIDLSVQNLHASQKRLDLLGRVEKGHGQGPNDLPPLVPQGDAVDEEGCFAARKLPPRAEFGLARGDDGGDARIRDEIRDGASERVFGPQVEIVGVRIVDETDDAVPVADEQARRQAAHGQLKEPLALFFRDIHRDFLQHGGGSKGITRMRPEAS